MKKGIIFISALSAFILASCNSNSNINESSTKTTGTTTKTTGTTTKSTNYLVTDEEYNESCYYSALVSRLTSLNYTVTYTEVVNDDTYQYITKVDNGKLMSTSSYGDIYLDFKEGTYDSNNRTWNFDGYYEEDGIMKKESFENEGMPDDIYLPSVGFIVGYEDVSFNTKTNCYEQIAEVITKNSHEEYSDVKIQFIDGNVTYISYKYVNTTKPEKVYSIVMEITDYGSTIVNLPTVE